MKQTLGLIQNPDISLVLVLERTLNCNFIHLWLSSVKLHFHLLEPLSYVISCIFRSREWKPESEGNCYSETSPIDLEGYWGSGSDLPTMHMVEKVLSKLSSEVSVLNITQLSEYRKDGHPSIYRKFWEALKPEQLSNPASYSDCIHWCLPGLPDVWNEFLFHFL